MAILLEFDKAGAEWVIVAYLTGDARMLDVIKSGRSPHTVTGALLSKMPEALVERENKLIGHRTDPVIIEELREQIPELTDPQYFLPRNMCIRQAGKKSNHGLNYDMGYRRFALENEMIEGDAKKIVNLYKEVAYPGIPIWHKTIREQLRKDRTLINCFGRKREFRDSWGPDLFMAAYAQLPQSSVYDITRIGMRKVWDRFEAEDILFKPLEPLAQVHDSNVYQYTDEQNIDALTELMIVVGLDYMNPLLEYNGREFYIDTTLKMGYDWSEDGMKEVKLTKDFDETRASIEQTIEELKNVKEAA